MFKRREYFVSSINRRIDQYCGIFTINQIRFEFVYLRTLKKVLRKKYIKKKNRYSRHRYWIMIKPNLLLSMKSKNSRMGSGVGIFVRVCCFIKSNKPILLLKNYPRQLILNIIKYFKLKNNINLFENILNM